MTKSAGLTRSAAEPPKQVFEHEGIFWTAEPGATASFEEFIAAREVFREIARGSLWNPWVREDRTDESDRALAVISEWTRAEPGFRQMTEPEIDEMLAESSERFEAEYAADVERWELDSERFDPEREAARLALLERTSRLDFVRGESERYAEIDPSIVSGWAGRIAELGQEAGEHPPEITRLETLVGNSEDVVDVRGHLPRDRRSTMLLHYQFDRERDVRHFRKQIPELKSMLKAAIEKTERSRLRAELKDAEHKLAKLLAVPPLDAEDMCADCDDVAHKLNTRPRKTLLWKNPLRAYEEALLATTS